jgi:hypothetical protein
LIDKLFRRKGGRRFGEENSDGGLKLSGIPSHQAVYPFMNPPFVDRKTTNKKRKTDRCRLQDGHPQGFTMRGVKKKIAPAIGRLDVRKIPSKVDVRRPLTDETFKAGTEKEKPARPWTYPKEANLWDVSRHLQKGLHAFERDHLSHGKNGRAIQVVRTAKIISFFLTVTKAIKVYSARDHPDRPSTDERDKMFRRH